MDRNEYTIKQQADGQWAVLCNGALWLGGLSKELAIKMGRELEKSQSSDEAEGDA